MHLQNTPLLLAASHVPERRGVLTQSGLLVSRSQTHTSDIRLLLLTKLLSAMNVIQHLYHLAVVLHQHYIL